MSTILKRWNVGNVNNQPGYVLMQTTSSLNDVQVAGFINSVESYSDVTVTPTDIVYGTMANFEMGIFRPVFGNNGVITLVLMSGAGTIVGGISLGGDAIYAGVTGNLMEFKGITAGTNVSLSPSADFITINATGGGGGFAYEQAYWVSQANGSDGNAGTSIDTPLATVQAAINLVASGAPVIIYVVDANGSNNETIVTPGLGYTIFINAPATSFQGSITQADGDELIVTAMYVDSFVSNSSSPTYLYGGEMFVTTTSTGTLYATLAQYDGSHTGGGTILVNTGSLNGLNTDNTINAYVNAPFAQNVNNGGDLFLNTNITPTSVITSNTGSITGIVGGVMYGFAGVAVGTATSQNYAFPLADGTANYFLQTNGAGIVNWAPGGGGSNFDYQQTFWVAQLNGSDSNNGTSINTPFLTLQHAINVASTTPTMIYLVDQATNNEGPSSLGTGQNLYIFAPGTSFSGFTVAATDTVYCDFAAVGTAITQNGLLFANVKVLSGGITATAGTSYVFTQYMGAYTGDDTSLAYITCENSNGFLLNGGTLNLNNNGNALSVDINSSAVLNILSPYPMSLSGDGTGVITGYAGDTSYSGGGINMSLPSGVVNYTLTNSAPSGANQVLLSSGAGPAATTSWGAPSLSGAVLLNPGHDQTITTGNLYVDGIVSSGNTGGGSPGQLLVFANDGSNINIISNGGGVAGQSGTLYFDTTAQQTQYILRDPAAAGAYIILSEGTQQQMGVSSQLLLGQNIGTEVAGAVTINAQSGVITSSSLTTAAGSTYVITMTNTLADTINANVLLTWLGGSNTNANFTMSAVAGIVNTIVITIHNNAPVSALNGTINIGFVIM